MKDVKYMGQAFLISDTATWIAADACGSVYTFTSKPTFNGNCWWNDPFSHNYVGKVEGICITNNPLFNPTCEAC